ncbi:ABC transporter permease [uncultured Draconibacterium sp.]|uniref:ABC transporter permease n=1 Tax=uncultured Draconibacterium sp. TaxID=1573823 RepID=UPI002AA729B5|nr:ABC transporter permease [uncultured Draconibacterium sp.]
MNGKKRHPIFEVLIREARRIQQNPAYRFLLLIGPIMGILLLFFIFQQGAAKRLPIALVDQDNSSLSVKVGNALNASPDVQIVAGAPDLFQAQEWLKQGLVQAIVVLPNELEKKVFQGMEAPVPVYINGTNVTVAGVVQRSVLTTLNTFSAGIQLKKLALNGNNAQKAMARVVPVKIQKHVLFNPYTNYAYFLNSAMMYFTLFLFAFMSSVYTFGNELKRGTGLSLLEAGNNSVRMAIAGKLFPYTLIYSGFAMLIAYLLYVVEGMPLNGSFVVIFCGQFITILAYQMLGLIFVAVTKNLRLSLSVGSAYIMMGITFSGLTFPIEGMMPFVKTLTAIFPFTWWEKLFISQSLRGAPIKEALPYLCYILLFMLSAVAVFKMYKKSLSDPKYWGKQ